MDAAAMFRRLPGDSAVVLYVDLPAVKSAGLLPSLDDPKVTEEPEYRAFAQATDFEWQRDLKSVMIAFEPKGTYILIGGQFDWKSLKRYVEINGGTCPYSFCRLAGSVPERKISFFPVTAGVMAMAVSLDDFAAKRMTQVAPPGKQALPTAPIWLSVPPSVVKSGLPLPAGTQMFARCLERSQSVTLAVVQENDVNAVRLRAPCNSVADAAAVASDLTKITSLVKEMIEREHHQPNPADLSGFLTSGSFRNEGAMVHGYWQIPKEFLTNILRAD
jgi:hypothetical protein